MSPADNSNSASFGLYAALPSGGELVELPLVTSVNQLEISGLEYRTSPEIVR